MTNTKHANIGKSALTSKCREFCMLSMLIIPLCIFILVFLQAVANAGGSEVETTVLTTALNTAKSTAKTAAITKRASQLNRIAGLIGDWSGTHRTPATQWDPEEISAMSFSGEWVLSEYHLEGRLNYEFEGAAREVLSHWSYDRNSDEFTVHWIDNSSSQSTLYKGKFSAQGELILRATRMFNNKSVDERLRVVFDKQEKWTIISENNLFGSFVEGGRFTAIKKR